LAKENKPSGNAKSEKPKPNENVLSIKTHTDGDFRFGKDALKEFGFGEKATLKVTILHLQKGKSVTLEIKKVTT